MLKHFFYLHAIIFALNVTLLLVAPFFWVKLRHTQIIKARTTVIDALYFLFGLVATVRQFVMSYFIATDQPAKIACGGSIWFDFVV
jgi:hypothetical protein